MYHEAAHARARAHTHTHTHTHTAGRRQARCRAAAAAGICASCRSTPGMAHRLRPPVRTLRQCCARVACPRRLVAGTICPMRAPPRSLARARSLRTRYSVGGTQHKGSLARTPHAAIAVARPAAATDAIPCSAGRARPRCVLQPCTLYAHTAFGIVRCVSLMHQHGMREACQLCVLAGSGHRRYGVAASSTASAPVVVVRGRHG